MFILQEKSIDSAQAKNIHTYHLNGALVSFEGIVRADQYNNSHVSSLLYIADTPACIGEGEKIIQEAISSFSLSHAVCIQRIGQVNAGEPAVWIGAWSAHRDSAFKGCRYIIEEVKKRLLIWKKEFYTDGTSRWIHGEQTKDIQL
jgi:molybdopterin synthase catalytic subunit